MEKSFPELRTIRSFAKPEDLDIRSVVMQAHQKNKGGNERILSYMLREYREPKDFASFVYLSQVQQAEIISPQQAAPILNYQEMVAKDHMVIENIFAAGSAQASSQAVQIEGLLNEIKNQGGALIQAGGLGVKNPKSQQTFAQDLQGIVNLAGIVLADYQLAKGN